MILKRYRLPILFQLAAAILLFTSVSYADEYEVVVAGTIELANSADPVVGDPFDLDGSNFELTFVYDTDAAPKISRSSTNPGCSSSSSNFPFVRATYSFTNRPNGAEDVVVAVGSDMQVKNTNNCGSIKDVFSFPQGSLFSPELAGLVAGNGAGLGFDSTYFPGTDPVEQLPVVDPADVVEINSGTYVFFSSQHGILYGYASANLVSITSFEGGTEIPGDVNVDGVVDFLDIPSFIAVLRRGLYQRESDMDQNGCVDLFDIEPLIAALRGR